MRFPGFPSHRVAGVGLSRNDLDRGDLLSIDLFSMLAPEAKALPLKLKWLELTVNVNMC
jgi:hypothetical protein